MNFEVSEGVEKAASEFEEFERRSKLYFQNPVNEFGHRKLQEQAKSVEEDLAGVEINGYFDELVIRDMKHNIEATTEYADFLRGNSNQQVDEMFNLLYGEGAFENLKEEAVSFDDEAEYRAMELSDDVTTDNAWKYELAIKEISHDISEKIESWSKQKGYMPEDFEFEIHMQPQGTRQRAEWRGEINQMNVPVNGGIAVIRDGDDVVYEATRAIFTQFHELVGHGVHQQNSEDLVYPNFAEKPTYRPSSIAHCEGVSQHREKLAEEFIEDKKEELPVLDLGMQLRRISEENRDSRKIYTSLVREMHRRDEIDEEEAVDMAAEVYGPDMAKRQLRKADLNAQQAFKEGCYSAGLKLMEDVNAEDRSPVAVTTGQWTPQVFPDVVDYLSRS